MERDLIKGTQFIISTKVDNVRSTGDVLSSTGTTYSFARFDTAIVDAEYFEKYTQLISASGNRDMLQKVGAISLDGLYVPYSTSPDYSGLLPHFERPTSTGNGVINVDTLNPFNPSHMFGTGVLNSGLSDTGSYNSSVWSSGGHTITAALVNSPYSTDASMEAKVHPVSSFFDADFYYRKKTELRDIRAVAHRAPLILSGPGYDTNGNPVPTGESGIMHPQAYSDPSLWKTGPLDARWDDSKKVWVATGGGGGEFISFVVDNVSDGIGETSAGCNYVLATVTDIGHQTTAASIGDTGVKIFDEDFCYFNLPIPVLIGIKGKAIAYRNTYSSYEIPASGTGVCITQDVINSSYRWVVTGLCCGEEVFDA